MPSFSRMIRSRNFLALVCYLTALAVYAWFAGERRLVEHTPFNHFALLAEGWLNGGLDLGQTPPAYAQGNDFARYQGKWYVTFPGLPAALLLPLVKWAGSAERVRDGQFFIWIAPMAPALLFLVLEKLRDLQRSVRGTKENFALALLFAFGTVYFFTAVQGTVWFAAHVVAVVLLSAYLLFSLNATRPWLAGLAIGLGFWTRTPVLFAVPFFAWEAWGQSCAKGRGLGSVDVRKLIRLWGAFAVPIVLLLGLSMLHNYARFDSPFEFGYHHLKVAWSGRIERWGLIAYHYLPRNLAVVLTSLPWCDPLRINVHGLALWFTTPAYFWLFWPKKATPPFVALLVAAACVSVPTLLYQNTGWQQFGYRFSNDYAPLLWVALALSGRRLGPLFWALAVWAVVVNAFGAWTFDKPEHSRFYYQDVTQRTVHQPD